MCEQTQLASLETAIRATAANVGGRVGVAAMPIDKPEIAVMVNADDRFPLASTFKVALAIFVLHRVERGEGSLGEMIEILPEHLVPPDLIATRIFHPGLAMSVANLIELMITESDNTATDILLRYCGGAPALTRWLCDKGFEGQRIDRGTVQLLQAFFALPEGNISEQFEQLRRRVPDIDRTAFHRNSAFETDPRDTTNPATMTRMLCQLAAGALVSKEHALFLINAMGRCRTGGARLRALLPASAKLANKTGSIGSITNDVGILTLSPDRTPIALSVYYVDSDCALEDRERVLAQIGRLIFDHFMQRPVGAE